MSLATAENPVNEFLALYTDDPVLFVREVLGAEPDPWQAEFLMACAARRGPGVTRVSVRSAHRVGKSCGLAFLFWWWACTRFPQKTMVSAATSPQLFDALVPEIKSWYLRLPEAWRGVFEVQAEGIFHRESPDESFMSFRTSKAESPESAAGIHSDHVLYLNDEASGIPDAVFEAQIGSFADPDVLYVLAGNPVRRTGFFYDTHRGLKNWITFKISAFDTARVGNALIEEAKERYGEDSNAYRVRVLGEFPTEDDNAVIPYDLMETALTRDVMPTSVLPIWGIDCARYGKDRSVIAKRQGNVLVEPVKTYNGIDTMQLCGRVMDEWNNTPPGRRPSEICVDVIGIGAGVTDRLAELGLPARGINVAESPAMGARYTNLKAELWFLCREWFETRACNLAEDKDLGNELIAVDYDFSSSGRIQIKSKRELASKGQRSPDLAEAFVLTFAGTAISATHGSKGAISWKTPLKRVLKSLV